MLSMDSFRRHGGLGALLLAVIVALIGVQITIVQVRYQASAALPARIAASGDRIALVERVLLDVVGPSAASNDARAALAALRRRQAALGDLRGADLRAYDAFLGAATRALRAPHDAVTQRRLVEHGRALIAVYDAATADAVKLDVVHRSAARMFLIVEAFIVLGAVLLVYLLVIRPRDRAIDAAMRDLELRRKRFAAMFDNSAEMMAIYEPNGKIVRANPSAIARLGFDRSVVGEHYTLHIAAAERASVAGHFAQAIGGRANEFETIFLDADGNEVPVVCNLSPVIVEEGIAGVVGAARDATEQRFAEAALLRSTERFRSLFEYSVRPILAMTTDGTIASANVAFERLSGYAGEELVGRSALMLVSDERRAVTAERLKGFAANPHVVYEGLTRAKDGQEIPVEIEISPIRVRDEIEGYFVKYRDLSADRAISRAIAGKDDRMRALYRVASSTESATVQIGDALALGARGLDMQYAYLVSIDGPDLIVEHRFAPDDLLPVGYRMRLTEAVGKRLRASSRAIAVDDLTTDPHVNDADRRGLPWNCFIGTRLLSGDRVNGLIMFLNRAPRTVPFDDVDLDFVDIMGTILSGAIVRETRDRELREVAFHDRLTGTVNRHGFEDHVERAVAQASRTHGTFALHFLDLNRFKAVNDEHGHEAGDDVLREVGRRLNAVMRGDDVVARIGGDEFAVLEPDLANDPGGTVVARRLAAALAQPMRLPSGASVTIDCSLGTAVYPRDGAGLAELLQYADRAMYAMKRRVR